MELYFSARSCQCATTIVIRFHCLIDLSLQSDSLGLRLMVLAYSTQFHFPSVLALVISNHNSLWC